MAGRNFLEDLTDVPAEEANIDIVAVHGLNPTDDEHHAYNTWTSGDKLWLRDFLPGVLPKARIQIFGYNANVTIESSTAGVRGAAESLLSNLWVERQECSDRPIIFIAHSLGGLVVKQALILAKRSQKYRLIHDATHSIVFFATPHRGTEAAGLSQIVSALAKEVLGNPMLESMKKDGMYSDELSQMFRSEFTDLKMICFYEQLRYQGRSLIVDKYSATFESVDLGIPLDADHINICKFESAKDGRYKQVVANIRMLALEAVTPAKPPATALHEACSNGNIDKMSSLINSGADINARNEDDLTPLMIAIEKGQLKAVQLLLDKKADKECTASRAKRPLSLAITSSNIKIVKLLLQRGASVDARTELPMAVGPIMRTVNVTPLGQAAHKGQEEIVRLLLEANANANLATGDLGYTPLHHAILLKHEGVIRILLEHGAKLDLASGEGLKAYEVAIKGAHWSKDPKGELKEVLDRWAAEGRYAEMASLLVKRLTKLRDAIKQAKAQAVQAAAPNLQYSELPANPMVSQNQPAYSQTARPLQLPLSHPPQPQSVQQMQPQLNRYPQYQPVQHMSPHHRYELPGGNGMHFMGSPDARNVQGSVFPVDLPTRPMTKATKEKEKKPRSWPFFS